MDRIAEQMKRGLVVDGLDSIVASGEVGDGLWWAQWGQDGIDGRMRVFMACSCPELRHQADTGLASEKIGNRRENALLTSSE